MKKLFAVLLFLLMSFGAHAAQCGLSYCPDIPGGGTISGSLAGLDGSGLLITTSGTTTGFPASELLSTPIDVRQMGAICDGAVHSGNLTAVHAAAALANGNPFKTVIDLPDNCVWGTNTTTGTETPIVSYDNTLWRVFGRQFHNVNNATTQGLFVAKGGYSDADTVSTTNVTIQGMPGNVLDTISRTLMTESRKMIVLGNCNNCLVTDINVSTSTFLGSFMAQGRNPTNVFFQRMKYRLMPSPDGKAGGDGIHFTGNINGAGALYNDGQSIDDCISITEENSTMANKSATGLRIIGNKCASYAFSGLKLYTGNSSTGSLIDDVIVDDNHFSVWGPKGVDGNCIKIQQEVGQIRNVRMGINTCDDANGNGVAVLLTAATPGGVDNVDLGRLEVKNYPFRGIEIDGNVNNTKSSGAIVGPFASPTTVVTTTLTAIVRTGANTGMALLASSTTGLANVSTLGTDYLKVSGLTNAFNNSLFVITAKDVTNSTVTFTANNISSTTDETGVSVTVNIINRTSGAGIYDRGSYNTRFENLTLIDPPSLGYQYTTYNGQSLSVRSIQYFAQNTAKVTVSATTGAMSVESPYSGYVTIAGASNGINNPTNGKIVSVSTSPAYLLVNIPGITSATDETSLTAVTGTTIYLPTNNLLKEAKLISQTAGTGFSLQAGQNVVLDSNRCMDFGGNICGAETNSTNVSGSIIINNLDYGMNRRTRQSWSFADGQEALRYGNQGTTNDWFSGVPDLIQLNSSGVSATSLTVATSGTFGNISITTGLTKTLNVSTTGGISATGNISANQFVGAFVGDGSGLLNISATASPGGSANQLQFNTGTATGGTAGITYNSSTLETSFTGNVIGSNGVSGSRVMGTSSGSSSAATLQVQAANNGLYRPQSNCPAMTSGGTESMRFCPAGVSTSLPFTAAGGISTSLGGATSRTLCVSPNGAIYASPTCP